MKASANQFRFLIRNILKENIEALSTEEKPLLDEKPKEVIKSEEEEISSTSNYDDATEILKGLWETKEKLASLSFEGLSENIVNELKNLSEKLGVTIQQKRAQKAALKKEAKKSWEPHAKVFEKRKTEREAMMKGTPR